jgi:16S rRNA (adenine1518-N6/adenine1519-N6)-dimethyltransferase
MQRQVKYLLKKYGLTPKKYWSQYFLISPSVISDMTQHARGIVLEIGPGLGFITTELARRADKVIAIEKDWNMIHILQQEYAFENVDIVQGDITSMSLPPFDRVISNIPYHLSSQITFTLLDHECELAVLSYQKEFAHRLVAPIPSSQVSRLTVMARIKADCTLLRYIPRTAYYPVPQTECALVKIIPHKKKEPDTFFENVVRALFTHKRKTIKNALLSSKDFIDIPENRLMSDTVPFKNLRAEMLSLDDICTLVDSLRDLI